MELNQNLLLLQKHKYSVNVKIILFWQNHPVFIMFCQIDSGKKLKQWVVSKYMENKKVWKKDFFMMHRWEIKCLYDLVRIHKKASGRGFWPFVFITCPLFQRHFGSPFTTYNNKFLSTHSYSSDETTAQLFWNWERFNTY